MPPYAVFSCLIQSTHSYYNFIESTQTQPRHDCFLQVGGVLQRVPKFTSPTDPLFCTTCSLRCCTERDFLAHRAGARHFNQQRLNDASRLDPAQRHRGGLAVSEGDNITPLVTYSCAESCSRQVQIQAIVSCNIIVLSKGLHFCIGCMSPGDTNACR